MRTFEIGKAVPLRSGSGTAILNFGVLLEEAREAAEQLDATLVDMRWAKPLDESMIADISRSHQRIVTVDENALAGGAGSGVA